MKDHFVGNEFKARFITGKLEHSGNVRWDRIQELFDKISCLEAQAAAMREALEYYGNGDGRNTFYGVFGDDVSLVSYDTSETYYSGRRAREALSSTAGTALLERLARLEKVAEAAKECLGAFDNDFGESVVGEALPQLKQALAALDEGEGEK